MENLQLRIQLRSTIQGYINDLMNQYNIPASMMEDALNSIMTLIKDAAMNEYVEWAMEQHNQTTETLESTLQELSELKEKKENENPFAIEEATVIEED